MSEVQRVIERIRAAVRMCYPEDMTPSAKRVLDSVLDEEEEHARSSP